jgi:hypothetical protein
MGTGRHGGLTAIAAVAKTGAVTSHGPSSPPPWIVAGEGLQCMSLLLAHVWSGRASQESICRLESCINVSGLCSERAETTVADRGGCGEHPSRGDAADRRRASPSGCSGCSEVSVRCCHCARRRRFTQLQLRPIPTYAAMSSSSKRNRSETGWASAYSFSGPASFSPAKFSATAFPELASIQAEPESPSNPDHESLGPELDEFRASNGSHLQIHHTEPDTSR